MTNDKSQDARIAAIIGDDQALAIDEGVSRFYEHLKSLMMLPCDVTGIEDFDWEEFYIIGPGNLDKHERLRETQPSYVDIFELLAIEREVYSEWMMFKGEDLAGRVRRKSDGKEFLLGLAELKAIDIESANHELLDDYAVWFVNKRARS